jgi:hypothetical protein
MAAHESTAKDQHDYIANRSWFVIFSAALVFGIVWTIIGENDMKIAFIAVAFALFLRSGILLEMSARKLHAGHH